MRNAIAQNPNMLRTLLGLSLTLIILLSYAVYGATQNPDYYVYSTDQATTTPPLSSVGTNPSVSGQGDDQVTTWLWEFNVNPANLTWLNVSVDTAPSVGVLKLLNPAGAIWSHPGLGAAVETGMNCADSNEEDGERVWKAVDCDYGSTHMAELENGSASIITLTHPDPARRGGGTVHAQSKTEAIDKASDLISHEHSATMFQLSLELSGNQSQYSPLLEVVYVNEEFASIEQFSIDAATEMIWAFASLAGCFLLLLVPAFAIYFASEARARKEHERVALTLAEDE